MRKKEYFCFANQRLQFTPIRNIDKTCMMKKLSHREAQMLKMLSHALWKSHLAYETDDAIDFGGIAQLAEEQDVAGFLFDVIAGNGGVITTNGNGSGEGETKAVLPKRLAMQWAALALQTERENLLYRAKLTEVLKQLYEQKCQVVLFKGATLAEYYPNPKRRPIGDVDLFVTLDQQRTVLDCLKRQDPHHFHIGQEYDSKHLAVRSGGLNWELHFRTLCFAHARYEKRYRLLELEESAPDALYHQTIEGVRVNIFAPLFTTLHLTAHIMHHLLHEQVTLRQVTDWMMHLHHERTSLGISEIALKRQSTRLGLDRLYRALGYICTTYLGLAENSYACISHLTQADRKRGEYLLRILLDQQIAGCAPYQPHLPTDSRLTKIKKFGELIKRSYYLSRLFPLEAAATPLRYVRDSIERARKRKAQ